MQIGNPLPANNLRLFRGRTESFKCSGSPLKPSPMKSPAVKLGSSAELTRKHLSSLEKLLDKETESSPAPEPRNDRRKGSPVNKGKLVLEELKLARIWPEMKAAEEMSPRHLNMLQRLLAMTPEYSPRNNLGSRWREYHGENDWSGLLDPLDENLRREIVRYGEFIQAAYHCFHTNPYTAAEEFPLPPHVSLPDKSYKVTKSLYATSSIGLPKWMDEVAPNLNWMTQRSSWIGYVAVCDDKQEIQRMGRRDIVIALRGTATCLEWAENMRDLLVQIPRQNDLVAHRQPKVECGFFSLYKTKSPHVSSLSQLVTEEVLRLQKLYKGETLSITVTGHSLGAALALLIADELTFSVPDVPPTAIFSFGGPRVGNRAFTNHINTKKIKVLRIVNSQDLITRVPGIFVNEKLDSKLRTIGQTTTKLLDVFDDFMPWAYSHVGIELRVDTKMSPFLKPDADMACCHDLEAYLHLVDGFLASNCPFRANAKRSPLRLLHEQKTNIKMLYTKKASALSLNQEREGNDILLSRQVITRYIKLPTSWR